MSRFAHLFARHPQKQVFHGVPGVPKPGTPSVPAISSREADRTPALGQSVSGVPNGPVGTLFGTPSVKGVPSDKGEFVQQNIKENSALHRSGTPGTPGTPAFDAGWDVDDWRVFFEERAAIAEHDGGLSPPEAKARAYECSVAHWCNLLPPPAATSDDCRVCGNSLGEAAVPVLRPSGGHLWLHKGCVQSFNIHRREEARRALAEIGITAPPNAQSERI